MNAEQVNQEILTKGEKFKKQFGYSRTFRRLMNKHNVSNPEDYKKIRKERKKKEKKKRQKKREDSRLYMRTKGKVRKSKHKKRTKGWSLSGDKIVKKLSSLEGK